MARYHWTLNALCVSGGLVARGDLTFCGPPVTRHASQCATRCNGCFLARTASRFSSAGSAPSAGATVQRRLPHVQRHGWRSTSRKVPGAVYWEQQAGTVRRGILTRAETDRRLDGQKSVPPAPSDVPALVFSNLINGIPIIDPHDARYRAWWALLIGAAAFTGFFVPWELGFVPAQELYDSHSSWLPAADWALVFLFCTDLVVSRCVAPAEEAEELLVDGRAGPAAAVAYRAQRRATDLVSSLPFDWLTFWLLMAGGMDSEHAANGAVALKLLHMLRLYRVRWFFSWLELDTRFSLLGVTLVRNAALVAYCVHGMACAFEGLCRAGGFTPEVAIGTNSELYASLTQPAQYLYSVYWAVTTLAGNEWNGADQVKDVAQIAANTARASVFLMFNILLSSLVIGTVTLVMVKADERTGRYRDLSSSLRTYAQRHRLPLELTGTLEDHLRLQFNAADASDDQVLAMYPTTIRRRILRHLYLGCLRQSYLFAGAPRKFLDAVLASARLELYRGGVEVLSPGDPVNELIVLVGGQVEVRSPLDRSVSFDFFEDGADEERHALALASREAQNAQPSTAGAQGWLWPWQRGATSGTSMASSTTGTPPAMHSFSEAGGGALASMMGDEADDGPGVGMGGALIYAGQNKVVGSGALLGEVAFFSGIPQMEALYAASPVVRLLVVPRSAYEALERAFPVASRLALENLRRHTEALAVAEFPAGTIPRGLGLSSGDTSVLDALLQTSPASLMYSWASPELVELMMASGSDVGSPLPGGGASSPLTPRQELALSNLVRISTVIAAHVAKQDEDRTTEFLYAATRGDVPRLRTMLQQGMAPDMADYDGRTALMLAASRGHVDVMHMLLSAGADPNAHDNLGSGPLLEAVKAGHDTALQILVNSGASLSIGPAGGAANSPSATASRVAMAARLCTCVADCDLPLLRRMLRAGAPADASDYDLRTALHIAAAEGSLAMVRLLVEEGGASLEVRDRWGATPEDEAVRVGANAVVAYLRARRLGGTRPGGRRGRASAVMVVGTAAANAAADAAAALAAMSAVRPPSPVSRKIGPALGEDSSDSLVALAPNSGRPPPLSAGSTSDSLPSYEAPRERPTAAVNGALAVGAGMATPTAPAPNRGSNSSVNGATSAWTSGPSTNAQGSVKASSNGSNGARGVPANGVLGIPGATNAAAALQRQRKELAERGGMNAAIAAASAAAAASLASTGGSPLASMSNASTGLPSPPASPLSSMLGAQLPPDVALPAALPTATTPRTTAAPTPVGATQPTEAAPTTSGQPADEQGASPPS